MNPELREHASRYVELLRRHGQRDVWLPSGLVRRLPTSTSPKTQSTSTPTFRAEPSTPAPKKQQPIAAPAIATVGTKAERLAALRSEALKCQI
jgi:hypothetical protein